MAVTAIPHRTRRGPSSLLRRAALLVSVVAWAAVFAAAYELGSRSRTHTPAAAAPATLAPGTDLSPQRARAAVTGSHASRSPRLRIAGLRPLPPVPSLRPATASPVAGVRAPVYYAPVHRPPAAGRPSRASTTTSPTTPTGGGPHGSGGGGGGTTTITSGGSNPGSGSGSSGGTGGGGLGTGTTTSGSGTTSTPQPTTSTPANTSPAAGG